MSIFGPKERGNMMGGCVMICISETRVETVKFYRCLMEIYSEESQKSHNLMHHFCHLNQRVTNGEAVTTI